MPHRPIFHPRIEADVRVAVTRYAECSVSLGERFKRTFYATVDDILFLPAKNAVKVDAEIRTRLIRPFPYLVYYVAEGDVVFILTVQYAGRRPAYLRSVARERLLDT
ncbi:MAG: hypothetical protein HY736_19880 [Verrucomicrobia bacterium]|nr:hypothetical protein [Verrucomicrobiota bacterium]